MSLLASLALTAIMPVIVTVEPSAGGAFISFFLSSFLASSAPKALTPQPSARTRHIASHVFMNVLSLNSAMTAPRPSYTPLLRGIHAEMRAKTLIELDGIQLNLL